MNSDRPQTPLHVLIVGGGIAGPALALFLRKAGISSTVYEAYPRLADVGGGLNLAPNGMHVLAQLGLAEMLIASGTRALESAFADERGNSLGRVKYGDPQSYGQPAVSMSRAVLHKALARSLQEQNLPIEYGKHLVSITQANDRVIAHFSDGTSAEGDLLVGADGVRSAVRQHLLPDGPLPAYVGIIGVGGFTPLSALPTITDRDLETITYTFGPNGFFGYGGGDRGTMMWWSNLPRAKEYSQTELAQLDWRTVQKELLERFGSYHAPIPALLRHSNTPVRVNVYDIQSLPAWHKGRVQLIGDAAHAVSPNAGQGASLALEDAMLLAKLLRDSAGDYANVFARFEDERKPRVEKIVAEGRRRAADKEIVSPLQSKLRNLMLKLVLRFSNSKSQDWILGHKIEWAS